MNYTKVQLINHLKKIFVDRGNRIPVTISLRNYKGPQYETYVKVFGSWRSALLVSGFDTSTRNFKKRSL